MHRFTRRAAIAAAAAFTLCAHAQQNVTHFITGSSPGGGLDTIARLVAEPMGASMKRTIIVESKPGASYNIAADFVAKLSKKYRLDLGRVTAVGHSAGGHLALWLAGRIHIPPASAIAPSRPPIHLRGVVVVQREPLRPAAFHGCVEPYREGRRDGPEACSRGAEPEGGGRPGTGNHQAVACFT